MSDKGYKPTHPGLRDALLKKVSAAIEIRNIFKERTGWNRGDLQVIKISIFELRDALALTEVEPTKVGWPEAMKIAVDDEVIAEVLRRLSWDDHGAFYSQLDKRLVEEGLPLGPKSKTLNADQLLLTVEQGVLIREIRRRLKDKTFRERWLFRMLDEEGYTPEGPPQPSNNNLHLNLADDEVFLAELDERMNSKTFARKLGELLGERVYAWLKGVW